MAKKPNHNLKILQWNAHSAVSNKLSLLKCLDEHNVDIALLSETWFKPGMQISFKGYSTVRRDRDDGYAGVAVLVKHNVNFKEISIQQNFSEDILICGIEIIETNSESFNCYSLYCPPDIRTNNGDWNKIFNLLDGTGLIGGDFNAHHNAWGSYKINPKGAQILDTLEDNDLVLLNTGEPTRITRNGNKSAVDLTFSSPNIAIHCSWNILEDVMGSDHFPLIIEVNNSLNYHCEESYRPKTKWNLRKANWEQYHHTADIFFDHNITIKQDIDAKYNFFVDGINAAATLAIPVNKPCKMMKKILPIWWDNECEEAVNKRKNELQNYKNNSNLENYLLCKAETARTKKFLKEKARQNWRNWCSKLNNNTPATELWNQARKMQRKPLPTKKSISSDWELNFFDKIAPPLVLADMTDIQNKSEQKRGNHHIFSEPIRLKEVNYALENRINTSPGYDDIRYPMLYHLPVNAKIYLTDIFNDIWIHGENIAEWKKIIVVPILKPGKNPDDSDSYRPISLLSCILKVFERIVKNRLELWLNQIQVSPSTQYGYRRNYGTHDAIAHLVTDIQLSLSENKYFASLFLDIKGAYDSVDWLVLHNKMIQLHIPEEVTDNICKLYINRSVTIRQNNGNMFGYRTITMGLPQGSVLSPLLFNIYTMDIHNTATDATVIQYADDFAVYILSKNFDQCLISLNTAVTPILQCIQTLGFELSSHKSQVVFFTRHNLPDIQKVTVDHSEFPVASEFQYLGITLDKKLTFKSHVDKVLQKCSKGLNFLKSVMRTWWGAHPKTALTFYKSYIRSIIDYGCAIYGCANNQTLRKLDILQNKALRLCIGAMKSTPIEPLRVETLEPPLHLRRTMISEKNVIKCKTKKSPIIAKLSTLNYYDLTNSYWIHKNSPPLCDGFRNTTNFIPPLVSMDLDSFLKDIKVITLQYSEIAHLNNIVVRQIIETYNDYTPIFTDASKNMHGTGASFIIPPQEQCKFKLNKTTSIFSAEAFAIFKAIEFALERNKNNIIIFTDSLSVLNSLKSPLEVTSSFNNPYVVKIKNTMAKSPNKHIFVWVKAHSGIIYNEVADQLAKSSIFSGEESNVETTVDEQINLSRSNMYKTWSNIYQQYCITKPTRYTLLEPNLKKTYYWYENYNYPRKYITTICRMKFGHACYPAHLHKIKILESNICENCNEISDLDHIFFNCRSYEQQSKKLLQSLIQLNVPCPFNIMYLLSTNDKTIFDALIHFVFEAKINL